MKVGDEVFVHGYVDEIRKDVIIIRNDGGYFGTVPSEMFYYKEDRNGYGTLNEADTPHTDKDKVVCPNCGRSDYIRSFEKDFNIKNSGYRYKCINCNTYIKDTPQTETHECERYVITNDEGEKAYGCMGCQTDCPWK